MTPKSRQPEHLPHQASRGSGFGPGQPSRTSIVVAALRAFGAREPDVTVRNPDWLAERLVTPAELQLITEHPIAGALNQEYNKARQSREFAAMSNLMVVERGISTSDCSGRLK